MALRNTGSSARRYLYSKAQKEKQESETTRGEKRTKDKIVVQTNNTHRRGTKVSIVSTYFRRVRRGSRSGSLIPVAGSIVVNTHL